MPIIEEETQSELSSKSSQNDTDGDENSETDTDNSKLMPNAFNINPSRMLSNKLMFAKVNTHYSSFFKKINTPPPKGFSI